MLPGLYKNEFRGVDFVHIIIKDISPARKHDKGYKISVKTHEGAKSTGEIVIYSDYIFENIIDPPVIYPDTKQSGKKVEKKIENFVGLNPLYEECPSRTLTVNHDPGDG